MMATHFSKPASILYWVGAANLVWITLELGTRIAAAVAPKGKTPLIAIILLGFALQPGSSFMLAFSRQRQRVPILHMSSVH